MLASQHPFRQIVGVEISPALHEIARENLQNYRDVRRQCLDIRLVRADAIDYTFPHGNLVIYLYNPFESKMVERFISGLCESGPREVVVLYHTPAERDVLEKNRAFELVDDVGFGAVYRANLT